MKASPSDQRSLLDLSRVDVELQRAEEARRNPPQAARVKELLAVRGEQGRALVEKSNARDDLKVLLGRVESDISVARVRQDRDRDRLEKTAVARDARALESEIEALTARIDGLETQQLELMEQLQAADDDVAAQQSLLDQTSAEGQELSAGGKQAVEKAAAELEQLTRDRAALVEKIPADLVADYDRLAARGPAVGHFQHGTCGGCHMALAPTHVAQLRKTADDEVFHCPECGGIIVRTAESGLA
ncbi:zinc ribbon domain-containing protein [Microbacterium gubbeenense]|uniref:zinc ribbon domain-containing protein n=1 Tax=Microbacterium gubbeenense TaxID=159896 RepID=UPI0003F619D2|nr:C4-type zinc ribbon domain-containing protein [Microbacterium gubbeenense]